jgi:glycosyltransferase involved in cell wall biosynthesis
MKIMIMCSYYNRPILVRRTLESVLRADAHHHDWEFVFGDDGSKIPGEPIVRDVLRDHIHKVRFVKNDMTFDAKVSKGIILGALANREMRNSDADIAIMLCDDDELHPEYLRNLSEYFAKNTEILYCYSKIHLFNPLLTRTDSVNNLNNKYNEWSGPIEPANRVDATQVAWRLDCCKKYDAWFADSTLSVPGKPWVKDTDKSFFENLFEKCGPCHPTGFVAQYKGVHDYQLLWHKNAGDDGLRAYDDKVKELAGVIF